MTERLSKKEIIKNLKNWGFLILENFEYVSNKSKIHIEDKNGYRYYLAYVGIYRSVQKGDDKSYLKIVHKSNPHSSYNIKLWMKKNNYKSRLISINYTNRNDKNLKLICEFGHEFFSSFAILKGSTKGSGCTICSGREVILENSFGYNFPELLDDWSRKNKLSPYEISWGNSDIQIYWNCSNGHEDYLCTLSNKRQGKGCPSCGGKLTDENNLEIIFPEILNEWDYEKNGSPKNYAPYSNKKVSWLCSNCGYNFYSCVHNRTLHGNGCPKCSETSDAEYLIESWLNNRKITNFPEKRFDDCRDKNTLPFDFYLPHYNLCIEYNGIQHYKEQKYFGGISKLKDQKKKDKIKVKYCQDKNINLLIIPYWEFDNIEEILEKALFG